jgi:hypothetical protein
VIAPISAHIISQDSDDLLLIIKTIIESKISLGLSNYESYEALAPMFLLHNEESVLKMSLLALLIMALGDIYVFIVFKKH